MPPENLGFPQSYTPPASGYVPPVVPPQPTASEVTPPVTPGPAPAAAVSAALPSSFLRRFGNSLLDGLAIGVVVTTLNFIISLVLGTTQESALKSFNLSAVVAYGSLALIVPVFYFLICESVWGRTIGKLATDTKVVDYTGLKPSFGRVFLRTICRSIPFDNFSFLFKSYPRGWHDKISGTLVVPNDLSPESVVAMDRSATDKARGPHRWAVVLISILAILQLLAVIFFIVMTVMFFLNYDGEKTFPATDARTELNDSLTRSVIAGMAVDAEMYRDMSISMSYEGFCTDTGTYGGARARARASVPVSCNDSATAWAASAAIGGGYWCSDSNGFGSTTTQALGIGETSCP